MSPIKNTRKSRADSDALGRFYTSPAVASLLVKKMDLAGVQTLVDLGCGSGNLAHAALGQWPGCSVLTVDLDEKVPVVIDERLAGSDFRHVQADVLGVGLVEELGVVRDSFDAAVCNPPFVRPVWCEAYGQLLAAAGFPAESVPASQVQADILFLAQNLMLLREGGVLGFIAPASFVSGKPYRALRAAILAQHRVRAVVRLPRNAFAQADARAFIVILEKGRPTETLVSVTNLSPAGVESAAHWIEPRQAALRLDGGPEDGLETSLGDVSDATENAGTQELADVALSVVRGSFRPGAAAAALAPHPLFHTTDFPDAGQSLRFNVPVHLDVVNPASGITVAEKDDILIARVGRNLHRKICRVVNGKAVMTDNVFRIRVRSGESERVFAALTSAAGQAWIARVCYGVGARHITKADLLRFPLP
jgi:type I restriction enzyme M protein